ncbi:MAG: hypothetical protein WC897_00615 [Candidatus Gracilibacteria bacterium]
MSLIITKSIKKSEFEPLRKIFSLEALTLVANKALSGLGDTIHGSKIPGTILKKMYLTSSNGAGRSVFLLQVDDRSAVLVLLRQKKDKLVGSNMTIKNIHFKKTLSKNLDSILTDLNNGDYEEYE